jgi:hypothetical protein
MAHVEGSGMVDGGGGETKGLFPTACPALLMPKVSLSPRLTTLSPLHSVATKIPPTMLYPTACPASLMPFATLDVEPGTPPRSMTLPWLHSVAIEVPPTVLAPTTCPASLMLWATLSAEPGRPPRRQKRRPRRLKTRASR